MTVPSFFSGEFRFIEQGGITDVQTALDLIKTEIQALAGPWTLVAGDEFESPVPAITVSADQRSMRVLLSKLSPTRMGFHVKDRNGNTVVDGTLDMAVSGTVFIFCGPHHLCVEFVAGGVRESVWANIIDTTPFSILTVGNYVVGATQRDSGGANEHILADECKVLDAGPVDEGRIRMYDNDNIAPEVGKTSGGSLVPLPAEVRTETASGVHRGMGKLTQMLVVLETLSPGDSHQVPLDGTTIGFFYVLGKSSPASNAPGRLAVRRA